MSMVVICGGGTGGHVTPGLAVAQELLAMEIKVAWLGIHGGIEERLVPAADIPLQTIDFSAPTGGLGGYMGCLRRLLPAMQTASKILRQQKAQVVLGLGGYSSLPGMCAGRRLGYRCLLHEQNVFPGLANRFLAPWMHRLLTSDPRTFAARDPEVTGNPVRHDFVGIENTEQRAAVRPAQLRLLVLGGSQGARSLNHGLPVALTKADSTWTVAHATGRGNLASTEKAYADAGIEAELVEFMDNVPHRLADADLVICRAGASTVAELACVGVAAVFVPYPHARQHQQANAAILQAAGAAKVLDDEQLIQQPQELAKMLDKLADRTELVAMGEIARALGKPQAARAVARACQEELAHAT